MNGLLKIWSDRGHGVLWRQSRLDSAIFWCITTWPKKEDNGIELPLESPEFFLRKLIKFTCGGSLWLVKCSGAVIVGIGPTCKSCKKGLLDNAHLFHTDPYAIYRWIGWIEVLFLRHGLSLQVSWCLFNTRRGQIIS